MFKSKKKTVKVDMYGVDHNGEFHEYKTSTEKQNVQKKMRDLQRDLAAQDNQLAEIQRAEKRFEETGNLNELIAFWEHLWNSGGLKLRGSTRSFRLADLYIKNNQYEKALHFVKKFKGTEYSDKAESYIQRITKRMGKK